jgi:hypothetical protein
LARLRGSSLLEEAGLHETVEEVPNMTLGDVDLVSNAAHRFCQCQGESLLLWR